MTDEPTVNGRITLISTDQGWFADTDDYDYSEMVIGLSEALLQFLTGAYEQTPPEG